MTPVPRPDYYKLHSKLREIGYIGAAPPRLFPSDLYVTAQLASAISFQLQRLLK